MGLKRTTGRIAACCGLTLALAGLPAATSWPAFADDGYGLTSPFLAPGAEAVAGGHGGGGNSRNIGNFRGKGRLTNTGNFNNATNHSKRNNITHHGGNNANGPQCFRVRHFKKGCVAVR